MSSSANRYWTDTSVLPADILSLKDYDFFKIVKQLTCEDVAEILRIQAINNVRVFMLVPDVLGIMQLDCAQLESIKCRACFHLTDGNYLVKIGIELSFRYLRDLFAMKIREFYSSNNDETNISDIGQKPLASSFSSNKRTRK